MTKARAPFSDAQSADIGSKEQESYASEPNGGGVPHKLKGKLAKWKEFTKTRDFVQTKDKLGFFLGVLLLLLSQYIMLTRPEYFWLLYSVVIFPLLVIRFFAFHKDFMHYFMLDFCYYCQLLALLQIYVFPTNVTFGKLAFALLNGPLPSAIVAWRLSLVFHDLSKLTSLLIHIYPTYAIFTLRWFPSKDFVQNWTPITLYEGVILPLAFYLFWQVFYIVKTEWFDWEKLQNPKLLTSAKWLSQHQPHKLYLFLKSKGVTIRPAYLLSLVQFSYTALTCALACLMYTYYWLHVIVLFYFFAISLWNGAEFYFKYFTKNYNKLLDEYVSQHDPSAPQKKKEEEGSYYPSKGSVISFTYFFICVGVCLAALIKVTIPSQ